MINERRTLRAGLFAPELVPFVLNWTDRDAGKQPFFEQIHAALAHVRECGSERDWKLAASNLTHDVSNLSAVGTDEGPITWGSKTHLIDGAVETWIVR